MAGGVASGLDAAGRKTKRPSSCATQNPKSDGKGRHSQEEKEWTRGHMYKQPSPKRGDAPPTILQSPTRPPIDKLGFPRAISQPDQVRGLLPDSATRSRSPSNTTIISRAFAHVHRDSWPRANLIYMMCTEHRRIDSAGCMYTRQITSAC